MSPKEKLAPVVAAGVLFTGVGAETASPAESAAGHVDTVQVAEHSPMQTALNNYRNRLLLKHQARIVMNTCVSWPNDTGGTTVTWNPGIAEVGSIVSSDKFFVFSTHDSRYKPTWGPLNGPEIMSGYAAIRQFSQSGIAHPVTTGLDRKITAHEAKGKNGTSHFNDVKTGQPVIDTVLLQGDASDKKIVDTCLHLRDDKPVHY